MPTAIKRINKSRQKKRDLIVYLYSLKTARI